MQVKGMNSLCDYVNLDVQKERFYAHLYCNMRPILRNSRESVMYSKHYYF